MYVKDEMHFAIVEDCKSGIEFNIVFDNLNDGLDFFRLYNRPIDVKNLQPISSFSVEPIFKEIINDKNFQK